MSGEGRDNIISMADFVEAKNAPDAEHVLVIVEDGKMAKWFRFGAEFTSSDGKSYGFDIWATGSDHAEEQVRAIKRSARIVGQILATVEA